MHTLKVGFIGAGGFARAFLPLFKAHPQVRAVSVADLRLERAREAAMQVGIREVYGSAEEVLRSDCDAVAIFTQRETHGPLALAALGAGKHVYCAVPAGLSVDEIGRLVEAVRLSGLTYMMGETSLYYPSTLFCRAMWRAGAFGHFVYGEGEYMHDMEHGFYDAFRHSGGAQWKRKAGLPPMYYPTHTASMIAGVTGAHFTHVSCLGWADRHRDGIFRPEGNEWGNSFSNETALLRTSDGGCARLNEFRRIGHQGGRSVRLSLFGTSGSFEEQPGADVWVNHALEVYDVGELLRCAPVTERDRARAPMGVQEDFYSGMAPVHPAWRLPASFAGLDNGHHGSHQFLVDDFVRACLSGALPSGNVWAAARFNLPGIIAHESAVREGERLPVPDLGDPPTGSVFLDDVLEREAPAGGYWKLPKRVRTGTRYWQTTLDDVCEQ